MVRNGKKLTMFEPTAGRLQLDINSLLVNIYIYRQLCWERGNIHCVRPLGRMHTILVDNGVVCSLHMYCWRDGKQADG